MRSAALLALLLVGAAVASPAGGSEESQALAARALIELNAGRPDQALALLDRAVASDPSDADALYQRGATRAKLGDYPGAIADERAALAIRPNFPEAALELGVALVETRNYTEAVPYLQQAQYQPLLEAQASFYLGLTALRRDDLDQAQENFARARARDPSLDLTTQYYHGVIAYRRNDFSAASTYFTAVQSANPDSAIGRESSRFLDLIKRVERAAYSAFGTVAIEYDSNVTVGAVAQAAGVSQQGDGRTVWAAGGTYVPWRSGPVSLALSYQFFQSLQFHLLNYNLQDNRPAAQIMFDFGPVFVALLGRYDYYLLGGQSFLSEATALPWVVLREPGFGRTEVYYRAQWRDYKNNADLDDNDCEPTDPGCRERDTFSVLSGFYNYGGVRQIIELGAPGRELRLGYQLGFNNPKNVAGCAADDFNAEDTRGSPGSLPPPCGLLYQYGSQQAEISVRWPLPYAIIVDAGYRYENQSYDPVSGIFAPEDAGPRRDNDHRVLVFFERPLPEISEHLFANVAYFGTWNNSNKADFFYRRQIGSVGLELRF